MIVYGRERKFFRSVEANCEIEEICPGKNIEKYGELFKSRSYSQRSKAMAVLVSAMNKGYEMREAFEAQGTGKAYTASWLTVDQCMSLDANTLYTLWDEATDAMKDGGRREVEAEPKKGKKTEEESELS